MITPEETVFLVDIDNTLVDNDRIQADLRRHLEREFGAACRDRYWTILEQLFSELGYRDYLGALQRYRVEHPKDIHLLSMSSYLVDYPFANRLYPGALDVLERLRGWARTGHPVRRRRRLPAAQGGAFRHRRDRRRPCADIHP
jgi:FMN phosphatase YigB (HAD superfamily)